MDKLVGNKGRLIFVLCVLSWGVLCGVHSCRATDTDVRYTDMLKAYEAGNLESARTLADAHLTRFESEYAEARDDPNREGALILILGTIHSLLQYEGKLDVGQRLAVDSPLMQKIESQLAASREHYAALTGGAGSQKAFLQREIGWSAVELIRSRAAEAGRADLERIFTDFRVELEAVGQPDLDGILTPVRSAADTTATLVIAEARERAGIWKAIGDYYDGLTQKDVQKLSSATGLRSEDATQVIAGFTQNLAQAEIVRVERVTLPAGQDLPLRLRAASAAPGEYFFDLKNIRAEVILTGGGREIRIWNKLIRLRRDEGGRWIIIAPK